MSASRVRQGQVYVEIGADPRKFFSALNRVQARIGSLGRSLASAGGSIGGIGMGLAAPFVASVSAGAKFQDTLLNIRASTGATEAELKAVRESAMQMSQALGVGPTEAATAFLELMKAGMGLETVLGGAGQAAIEFAAVGQMGVAQAAVVMSDAMNVFGVSAETASNAISAAADASSTSIEQMAQSFSMASAVAGLANQSIGDLSAALAILANNGIKGSDAGTSIKTMLLRLMAPADDAVAAMAQIGLTVDSFRGADGKVRPMVEIIRTLNKAMAGMDQAAKDDVFRRIFGADAIRAAAILTSAGVAGFDAMTQSMDGALPVSEKYKTLMSGITGGMKALVASLERMAIAITDAVGGSIAAVLPVITAFVGGITRLINRNKETAAKFFKLTAAAIATGGALIGLGVTLQVVAFALGGLVTAAAIALSPLALVGGAALFVGSCFTAVIPGVISLAYAAGTAIVALGSVAVPAMAAVGAAVATAMAGASVAIAGFGASALPPILRFGTALRGVFRSQYLIARSVGQSMAQAVVTAFGKMLLSIGPIRTAFNGLSSLAVAIGSDIVKALSPITTAAAPIAGRFVAAGRAAMEWAAATATAATTYMASIGSAIAATVTARAKMVASYAGQMIAPVVEWAKRTAASAAAYVSSLAAAAAATVVSAATMAGAMLTSAAPATAAWVAGAAVSVYRYIASIAQAAAATVANAARIAIAWVASGMPGLWAFASGAMAAIGSYMGSVAMAVASSVAGAAAIAAAWLAPLAPVVAMGAAVAVAGAVAYSFGGKIKGALNGVGELASTAGASIGTAFSGIAADAGVVFSDLYGIAETTFSGISDAIMSGDLMGAMDILWAGLIAGWLRGTEAIMSYVDRWVTTIQNAFTDMGTGIAILWEQMWTALTTTEIGATLLGVFDNIANGVMATWDWLVSAIQKAWIRVQDFMSGATDTQTKLDAIDQKNQANASERERSRPGVVERQRVAREEADRVRAESAQRTDAMVRGGEATKQGRANENKRRADERRANTQAAEQRVSQKANGAKDRRAGGKRADELLDELSTAETMDELRAIAAEFHALNASGAISDEQMQRFQSKADQAGERIQQNASGTISQSERAAAAGAAGAADAAQSKGEIAGAFSAFAAAGMSYGQSLAQKTADAAVATANNTQRIADQGESTVGE